MNTIPFGSAFSNRTANGKEFKNIGQAIWRTPSGSMLKWQWSRLTNGYPHKPVEGYKAFGERWLRPCNMGEVQRALRAAPETADFDRAFWIGHATQLLCLRSGTSILFDPIFSKRASPLTCAGPARRFPPPTTVAELPHIDIVTISHNHYDHMDKQSIVDIFARFPDVTFVVPLEMHTLLEPWGIPRSSIITLDWWDDLKIKDVVIGCLPAHHWGRHSMNDTNKVLWCGWAIGWNTKSGSVDAAVEASEWSDADGHIPTQPKVNWSSLKTYYFTGDTAFSDDVFRLIHRRIPRIDMAALPIGAYAPRWFMSTQHIDPEHAVKIFKLLNVQRAFAVHWGTFELADESLDEPPQVLAAALAAEGVPAEQFITVCMGDHVDF